MWSSEPRESIAICKANVAALFLNHFKTLSVGPVPRIERGCSRALYLLSYSSRVYNCKTCHIAYFFSRPLEVLSERQKQLISLEWDIWLDCKTVCFFLKIGLVKSPRGSHTHAREKKKTTVRFPYIEGLFRTSRYCHAKLVRLQLARLQHDTSTTWFQTSNLFQSNRTVACERQTFLLAHRRWRTFLSGDELGEL